MMNSSDNLELGELILKIRGGDQSAFSSLVAMYTPMINGVIRRRGLEVSEAFSDGCMALYNAALSYDLGQSEVTFGLYASICVTHRILDIIRRESGAEIKLSELDVEAIPVDSDILSRLIKEERSRTVRERARQLLSNFEYSVFRLWLSGHTTSAIAKELKTGAKAVDNAKSRIMRKLREGMDLEGD